MEDDCEDCWECGSDLIDVSSSREMRITVIQCTDCDLRREYSVPEDKAIKKWNKEARKRQ